MAGRAWQEGACMAGGVGGMYIRGACMAGGVHGRGHVMQGCVHGDSY